LVLFWFGYEVVFHFDGTEALRQRLARPGISPMCGERRCRVATCSRSNAAFEEPVGRSDKHLPVAPQTEQIQSL
jgi:hypothetical protein